MRERERGTEREREIWKESEMEEKRKEASERTCEGICGCVIFLNYCVVE